MFILGASGFVGSATIEAALGAGLSVGAWARTEAQAQRAAAARRAGDRAAADSATKVVVDLIQPKLPERLTAASAPKAAQYRVEITRSMLPALPRGACSSRSAALTISTTAIVSHRSPFTVRPWGFARIGASVRAEVLASGSCSRRSTWGPCTARARRSRRSCSRVLAKGRLPIIGTGATACR